VWAFVWEIMREDSETQGRRFKSSRSMVFGLDGVMLEYMAVKGFVSSGMMIPSRAPRRKV